MGPQRWYHTERVSGKAVLDFPLGSGELLPRSRVPVWLVRNRPGPTRRAKLGQEGDSGESSRKQFNQAIHKDSAQMREKTLSMVHPQR